MTLMRGGIQGVATNPPVYLSLPAEAGPLLLVVFIVLLFFSRRVLRGWNRLQISAFMRFQEYEMPDDQKVATAVLGIVLLILIEVALLVGSLFLMSGQDVNIRVG
jgi:hypothetical protein